MGNTWLLRIDREEEIVETITAFLKEQGIEAGSISGIGAADSVTLRYYSLETKEYYSKEFEGEFEIASLTGNVSVVDGQPWPHVHIVLAGTDYKAFGGHLHKATVGVTCEVIITPIEGTIERELDEAIGLKLWQL